MTEEKKDKEEFIKDLSEGLEKEGIEAEDDTFGLIAGKGEVFFLINNPPGHPDKVLAIQLPPNMAIKLGNGLINCGIAASEFGEGEEEDKEAALPPIKEEVKKEYMN